MIPKIIHYIWFGDQKNKPQKRIDQWKVVLPDWHFKEWTEDNLNLQRYPYVMTAYKMKRYGICIDPFRPYILHTHGGVWLDTDVNVYRDFSPLLDCSLLVGRRYGMGVSLGVLGAEPNQPVLAMGVDYYNEHWARSTVAMEDASPSQFANVHGANFAPEPIFLAHVRRLYGIPTARDTQTADGIIRFEDPEVLSIRMKSAPGNNYAEHLFEGSWCKDVRAPI